MADYPCGHAYNKFGYICCDFEKEAEKKGSILAHSLCRYYNFCSSKNCVSLKAGFENCEKLKIAEEKPKANETQKASAKKSVKQKE